MSACADRKRQRERLAAVQPDWCPLCHRPLSARRWKHPLDNLPTREHVVPRAKISARSHTKGNLFLAHARCNHNKGARMPTGCELIWLALVNAKLGIAL